jgi:hypothetical protein
MLILSLKNNIPKHQKHQKTSDGKTSDGVTLALLEKSQINLELVHFNL